MATVIAIQFNSALPILDDGWLVAEGPGAPLPPADPVPVLFPPLVLFVLFESGPVRKKLPAIGLPRPTSCAKREMLKLLMGVDAFTNLDATAVKFAGWTNSSRVYLRVTRDTVQYLRRIN